MTEYQSITRGYRLRDVTCVVCGRTFEARSDRAKYCSEKCAYQAKKKLREERSGKKASVKRDSYFRVRTVADALGESVHPFSAGSRAVDAVQGTSTRVVSRGLCGR